MEDIGLLKEKFLNKEELDENAVEVIITDTPDGIKYVDEIEGEDRRWSRTNRVIFEVNGIYFELEYDEGLTEYQDNEYWAQTPIEVKKVEKTIVVTDWEEIKE